MCSCSLDHFFDVPLDDLFSIARAMVKKACDLDPIPESLLTSNLHVLRAAVRKYRLGDVQNEKIENPQTLSEYTSR